MPRYISIALLSESFLFSRHRTTPLEMKAATDQLPSDQCRSSLYLVGLEWRQTRWSEPAVRPWTVIYLVPVPVQKAKMLNPKLLQSMPFGVNIQKKRSKIHWLTIGAEKNSQDHGTNLKCNISRSNNLYIFFFPCFHISLLFYTYILAFYIYYLLFSLKKITLFR